MGMKYHYVYRIDRPSTGQWYAGIRTCKCWPTEDTSYLGSGVHVKRVPREQLSKTILVIVETREEAQRIEAALVGPEQVSDPLCMNLIEGGERGSVGLVATPESRARMRAAQLGRKHSPETIEKMKLAQRGVRNPMFGRTHTEEAKAKMSLGRTGRVVSEETREKLRVLGSGRTHTEETKAKIRSARLGSKHSPESRAKMSVALLGNQRTLGKKLSAEHKAKIAATSKRTWDDPEYRKKMSEKRRGRKHSAETRAKISASARARRTSLEGGE